jgi:hypothetical protein
MLLCASELLQSVSLHPFCKTDFVELIFRTLLLRMHLYL